ncbi:UPF0149 family protein [Acidihalobacter prosperus]
MTDPYAILDAQLSRSGAELGPAEAHGLLCGLLVVDIATPVERCLGEVMKGVDPQDANAAATRRLMDALIKQARSSLVDEDFEFQPLLPHADAPLPERVQALASWCEGFAAGVGLAGMSAQRAAALPESVDEFIRDVGEIARVEPGDEEDEDAEEAFAELLEYVRVGVLVVGEELRPPSSPLPGVH